METTVHVRQRLLLGPRLLRIDQKKKIIWHFFRAETYDNINKDQLVG